MATKYWISTSSTSFTTGANWSDSAAPGNNDTLIFNHLGTANCSTNTASSLTGVTVIVEQSYTGQLGALTSAGVATYFQLDGGTVFIGRKTAQGSGSGPTLVMLKNSSTTAMTVNVLNTSSSSASTYYPPVMITGGTAITVNHSGGNVGVSLVPGESATVTYRIAISDDAAIPPSVTFGSGVTVTELTANGGTITSYSSNTNTNTALSGTATYTYLGTGAHTTIDASTGTTVIYSGTGTLTTGNLRGGSIDFSRDSRAKTVTTLNTYRGYSLNVNNGEAGSITFTNAINHYDGLSSGTITDLPGMKGTLTNI